MNYFFLRFSHLILLHIILLFNQITSTIVNNFYFNTIINTIDVELNTTDIVETICSSSGVKTDDIIVEIEMDENGHIISVNIYVDDEESANMIMDSINELEKGEDCGYGVLCRSKSVKISSAYVFLSGSERNSIIMALSTLIILTMM